MTAGSSSRPERSPVSAPYPSTAAIARPGQRGISTLARRRRPSASESAVTANSTVQLGRTPKRVSSAFAAWGYTITIRPIPPATAAIWPAALRCSGEGTRRQEGRERERLDLLSRLRLAQDLQRLRAHLVEGLAGLGEDLALRALGPDLLHEADAVEPAVEAARVAAEVLAALAQARLDLLEQPREVAQHIQHEGPQPELLAQKVQVEVPVAHVGGDPEVVVAADVEVPLRAGQLEAPEAVVEAGVEQHGRLVPEAHEAVVEIAALRLPLGGLAREVARDQVGQEVVLQRDEVAAGAVERIRRGGGLAGEPPAIGVEEAARPIRNPGVAAHVEQLGAAQQRGGRAVLLEKSLEAFRPAQLPLARHQRAGHPHAGHPSAQRDEPDPVAGITEMDGREPARGVPDPRAEGLGPQLVDVDHRLEAAPDRADRVALLGEAKALLARDQPGPPGGVDHPACAHALPAARVAGLEAVRLALLSQLDPAHPRPAVDLDAVTF